MVPCTSARHQRGSRRYRARQQYREAREGTATNAGGLVRSRWAPQARPCVPQWLETGTARVMGYHGVEMGTVHVSLHREAEKPSCGRRRQEVESTGDIPGSRRRSTKQDTAGTPGLLQTPRVLTAPSFEDRIEDLQGGKDGRKRTAAPRHPGEGRIAPVRSQLRSSSSIHPTYILAQGEVTMKKAEGRVRLADYIHHLRRELRGGPGR